MLNRVWGTILGQFMLAVPLRAAEAEPSDILPFPGHPEIMGWQGAGSALIPNEDELLSGLELSAKAAFSFDNNINQADGLGTGIKSDLIASIGASAGWTRNFHDFTVGLAANVNHDHYGDHEQWSGWDYGSKLTIGYQGGPLEVTGACSFASIQGIERFTGSLSTTESTVIMTRCAYEVSPKTSLEANLSLNESRLESLATTAFQNSTRSSADAGVAWQASPLTKLSFALRATEIATGSSGNRSTLGPSVTLDYQLTEKLDLDSRIGMDFVSASISGVADTFITGRLGLNYQLDPLWSLRMNLTRDVEAAQLQAGGFREVIRLRFGVIRKIHDLQLGLGWFWEDSTISGSGVAGSGMAQVYTGFDANLSYPLFGTAGSAAVFIRSHQTESDTPGRSWEGCQTGFSITRSF